VVNRMITSIQNRSTRNTLLTRFAEGEPGLTTGPYTLEFLTHREHRVPLRPRCLLTVSCSTKLSTEQFPLVASPTSFWISVQTCNPKARSGLGQAKKQTVKAHRLWISTRPL